MHWLYAILVVSAFLLACIGTKYLISFLHKKHIYDMPNARSNHVMPIPRGGGLIITGIMLMGICTMALCPPDALKDNMILFIGMLLLAVVSFLDDLKGMPIRLRFGVQLFVIALSLSSFPPELLFFQGFLPPVADRLLAGIGWLWFINLYNFMDGIDGIAGSETISISMGLIVLATLLPLPEEFMTYGLLISATTAGFLVWNWHPAKIFMGDVGSIPLGFILGWLLLLLAGHGYWAAALILPAYYLADSSITLTKRLLQGKKIWEAHSEHYYQQAVRSGKKHHHVVYVIILVNILLIGLAVLSTQGIIYAWGSIVAACGVIFAVLRYLRQPQKSE